MSTARVSDSMNVGNPGGPLPNRSAQDEAETLVEHCRYCDRIKDGYKCAYDYASSIRDVAAALDIRDRELAEFKREIGTLRAKLAEAENTHECRREDYCRCSPVALEPDERCEIHGRGEWPPRCVECGRFLSRELP